MSPVISVLLPVRNGMPYLPAAIESLRAQTFCDIEILVIDDGSTDDTAAYLRSVCDPRVRVLTPPSPGIAAALNAGLAAARGRYVARQDADDWSHPDRLRRQVSWLEARRDVDVLATAGAFVDERGAPLESAWTRAVQRQWDAALTPDAIATLLPLTCCIIHGTVLLRTAVLRAAGGYDQAAVPAEDYDLWLRLLPAHRFARLADTLYTWRIYDGSSSARRREEQLACVIAAKLRHVRRQVPSLPWPVRLVLPDRDRGADVFRRVGPSLGFDPALGPTGEPAGDEVVAITDLATLPSASSGLTSSGAYEVFGNVFVRRGARPMRPARAQVSA